MSAQKFQDAVKQFGRAKPVDQRALRDAEGELNRLLLAIKSGAGEIPELVRMLKDAKAHVERLQLEQHPRAIPEIRALPHIAERYLADLGKLIQTDVARSREMLRRLLGQITLEPREDVLTAVLRGNLAGVFSVGKNGAGGRI